MKGCFADNIRSLLDPCGSWQFTQLSTTGACSHSIGPRFSAWQLVQLSLTVVPALSNRTLADPCTLWHEVQLSLPSRTGMWLARFNLFTTFRWHVAHSSASLAAFSCDSPLALWMLWQVV